MKIDKIVNVKVNNYTGDPTERGYDFSILNSVNTCPFYGILRHIHNKVLTVNERNMALECGDLCHKCFACYRALSVYDRGRSENNIKILELGRNYLTNLFKELLPELDDDRVNDILRELFEEAGKKTTLLAKYTVFSDFIIDNSGYYDDPDDKKRTIDNIKTSLLSYLSNFLEIILKEPVWVDVENDKLGIEIPFNLYITITFEANGMENEITVHFIGKVDGIHVREDGTLIIHENKTASRLDDSWLYQWYKSHQITGYCLAGSYFTGQNCFQARVLGMQIPAPKFSGYAFRTDRVDRCIDDFSDWARWIISNIQMIEEYQDNPEIAPMNTHACCKYYKQCAFMPICTQNEEERKRIIAEEMQIEEWNPLDD